jgi:hypothetical protein
VTPTCDRLDCCQTAVFAVEIVFSKRTIRRHKRCWRHVEPLSGTINRGARYIFRNPLHDPTLMATLEKAQCRKEVRA